MPFVVLGPALAAAMCSFALILFVLAIWSFAKDRNALVAELEHARVAAEAGERAKARFIAMVSHEVRTPLTGIVGIADLLERTRLDDDQRHLLGLLQGSAVILDRIVDDVLTLSKREAGRLDLVLAPLNLADAVTATTMAFGAKAATKGVALEVEVADVNGVLFMGDEARIRQIVANLVGNAVKVTDDGRVIVSIKRRENGITINVADTGPGFAPEARDRIFEPFEQEAAGQRAGGTSLGLSIVRSLVQAMDGAIELDTDLGKGARFLVHLPLAEATRPDAAIPSPPSPQGEPFRDLSALVVDDHKINCEVSRLTLSAVGLRVTTAEGPEAALELSASRSFDVAFVDMNLPGMNGSELARRLRTAASRHGHALTTILCTASAREEVGAAAEEFDAFLAKPLRPPAILASLASALAARASPSEDRRRA